MSKWPISINITNFASNFSLKFESSEIKNWKIGVSSPVNSFIFNGSYTDECVTAVQASSVRVV